MKDVYKEVTDQLGGSVMPQGEELQPTTKKNGFNRLIDVIVGIISPIIRFMDTGIRG